MGKAMKDHPYWDPAADPIARCYNAIKAHNERIATLKNIVRGEPISDAQHAQLVMMKIFSDDPSIANYKNIIALSNENSTLSMERKQKRRK